MRHHTLLMSVVSFLMGEINKSTVKRIAFRVGLWFTSNAQFTSNALNIGSSGSLSALDKKELFDEKITDTRQYN